MCKSTWRYFASYCASYLSIHQNAANCMTISFRYTAQPGGGGGGGYGKPTTHAHVMMFDPLRGMPSKKIMELLEDVCLFCLCRNCSKARPHVSR